MRLVATYVISSRFIATRLLYTNKISSSVNIYKGEQDSGLVMRAFGSHCCLPALNSGVGRDHLCRWYTLFLFSTKVCFPPVSRDSYPEFEWLIRAHEKQYSLGPYTNHGNINNIYSSFRGNNETRKLAFTVVDNGRTTIAPQIS